MREKLPLEERLNRVYDYLKEHQGKHVRGAEVAKAVGYKGSHSASRIINILVEQGRVVKGSRNIFGTAYWVNDEPKTISDIPDVMKGQVPETPEDEPTKEMIDKHIQHINSEVRDSFVERLPKIEGAILNEESVLRRGLGELKPLPVPPVPRAHLVEPEEEGILIVVRDKRFIKYFTQEGTEEMVNKLLEDTDTWKLSDLMKEEE